MTKQKTKTYAFGMKMEFYPNHRQRKYLLDNIHTSRFIYNQLVANGYTDGRINKINRQYPIPESYWHYSQQHKLLKISTKRLTGLRRVLSNRPTWMDQLVLDSDMFNNTEKQYRAAWNMFRKVHTAGTPKFKKRATASWSYTTSNHYAVRSLQRRGEYPTIYNGSIRMQGSASVYSNCITVNHCLSKNI